MGLETRGDAPGGSQHREVGSQARITTDVSALGTGERPIIVRRPRTLTERAAAKAERQAKVGVVAGLMHDYRAAQARTDGDARAMLAKAEVDERYRHELASHDWHQAEHLVGQASGDSSVVEGLYRGLIAKAEARASHAEDVAHAIYELRILQNPHERDLPPEEAAKQQRQDWSQALQWLDDVDEPAAALANLENEIATMKTERTTKALVVLGRVLANSQSES